jgi:hypothetical protein
MLLILCKKPPALYRQLHFSLFSEPGALCALGVKNRQTVKSLPDTVQKAIRVFTY